MAGASPSELGKRGWRASGPTWISLVSEALYRRGITPHMSYIEKIIRKTFENNAFIGGNIGWQTIDSYVGYLQATDQLGVPIKCHNITEHYDKLQWAPRSGGMKKPFDREVVFGGKREPSTTGLSMRRASPSGKNRKPKGV